MEIGILLFSCRHSWEQELANRGTVSFFLLSKKKNCSNFFPVRYKWYGQVRMQVYPFWCPQEHTAFC